MHVCMYLVEKGKAVHVAGREQHRVDGRAGHRLRGRRRVAIGRALAQPQPAVAAQTRPKWHVRHRLAWMRHRLRALLLEHVHPVGDAAELARDVDAGGAASHDEDAAPTQLLRVVVRARVQDRAGRVPCAPLGLAWQRRLVRLLIVAVGDDDGIKYGRLRRAIGRARPLHIPTLLVGGRHARHPRTKLGQRHDAKCLGVAGDVLTQL